MLQKEQVNESGNKMPLGLGALPANKHSVPIASSAGFHC